MQLNKLKDKRGVTLILTFIFLVALVIIVLAYSSLVTYDTRNVGAQANSKKAFYLAEAGLNKAVWYLLNTAPDSSTDGSWRTTAYPAAAGANTTDPQEESLGEGVYTIWVEDSGSEVMITSEGEVNGIERTVRHNFEVESGESVPEAFTYTSYAGGNIDFTNSGGHAQVDGDIGARGNIDEDGVPVSGDVDDNSSIEIPEVDYGEYENIADYVISGDKAFAKNSTSSGIWYVKGNVEIKQNAVINGTIIAEGNISFTGNNGTVTASSPYPALVAQGNILGGSNNNVTITGAVFSEGDFEFNNCNNFTFTGSLVVEGNIEIKSSNNFNITFESSNPPYFTGGEVGGGGLTVSIVTDTWQEI